MIYAFIVDTSASMNVKYSNGMTYLEAAKAGIEHFMKLIQQMKNKMAGEDKFLLVDYDEPPYCIKSGFKDSSEHLLQQLKNLKAQNMSLAGTVLSSIFDYLNLYRMQGGLETSGCGRLPGFFEPQFIFWFTDGEKFTSPTQVSEILNIPGLNTPGSEFHPEPFRWDQRLYTFLLNPNPGQVEQQIIQMCDAMGGSAYHIRAFRELIQSIDNFMGAYPGPPNQRTPHPNVLPASAVIHIHGVLVNFEELSSDKMNRRIIHRHKLIYVNPNSKPSLLTSNPIPEPYWVDEKVLNVPSANAHPTISVKIKDEIVDLPEGIILDRYQIEYCPLVKELISRPQNTCWFVFIKGSYKKPGHGFPFGYLKANSQLNAVNLYIAPYNFPWFFKLLFKLHQYQQRDKPPIPWIQEFQEYLRNVPLYYIPSIRTHIKRFNLDRLIPKDLMEISMNRDSVKKLQNIKFIARNEYEKSVKSQVQMKKNTPIYNELKNLPQNPFDISRHNLLPTLKTMKEAFFKAIDISKNKGQISKENNSDNHSVPISKMGDYHQAETKNQYFRDVFQDEETTKWLQKIMFGNPFLKYKKERELSIDEADEAQQTMDEANNLSSSSSVSSLSSTSSSSSSSSMLGILRRTRKRSYVPENPFNISKIPRLNKDNDEITIPNSLNIPIPIEKWRNESVVIINNSQRDKPISMSTNVENNPMIEDKQFEVDNLKDQNSIFDDFPQDKNISTSDVKKSTIPGLQYSSNEKSEKKKENEEERIEEYELEDGEVQEEGEISEENETENQSISKQKENSIYITANDKICIDNIVNEGEVNSISSKDYIEFRNTCSVEIRKFGKDYNENNVKKLLTEIKKATAINTLQKQKLYSYCLRLAVGFKNKKLIYYLETKYKV
ncbi:hypothetical protein BCR36DRAFT_408361 [Piromyces finnis]|uniref:Uncharacterized protein n=1 Tax=Piromyces finnis TaxID=1754191 RepID=A0A1Y1VM43_9FUNG|nr:hypothetical protein BCR36DRAFT_408361 [Piromyces finnis]|eukprot:ORX59993.1 hypothetical protein BCR36DRAFT_408361 [Piromyces finnis]